MDSLPREIIFQIVSYLGIHKAPLTPLAITSKSWQTVVESATFCKLKIRSTELAMFKEVFCNPGYEYRQTLLHELRFEVTLPAYPDTACAEYENEKDRSANSAVFSCDVSSLVHLLAGFRADNTALVLELEVLSQTDQDAQSQAAMTQRLNDVYTGA